MPEIWQPGWRGFFQGRDWIASIHGGSSKPILLFVPHIRYSLVRHPQVLHQVEQSNQTKRLKWQSARQLRLLLFIHHSSHEPYNLFPHFWLHERVGCYLPREENPVGRYGKRV